MYLIQTVQTTWRPQLPLPKELQLTEERNSADDDTKNNQIETATTRTTDNINELKMDRLRHNQHHNMSAGSSQQISNKQKWSFGRLFRKKKEAEGSASSSEEDRKAGFTPKPKSKPHAKSSRSSGSSNKALGFDHIVMPPSASGKAQPPQPHIDNEFFLPVEMVPSEPYYQNQPGYYNRSCNSLDRRLYLSQQQQQQQQPPANMKAQKSHSTHRDSKQPGHSSEEELISLNSSTFSKYRSDESLHSGGQALLGGLSNRRSRAARNERYYKRLSRDGEESHGGVPARHQHQLQQQQLQLHPVPAPTQRYKTQPLPLSIYQVAPTTAPPSSAYVQWQPQTRPLQNTMQNDAKRSISYDSQIHLQNTNGRLSSKPLPPPPPPRDPLRRVHLSSTNMVGSSGDMRPVSYAFDKSGRCVSDDRMWQPPHYQSVHSLNSQPSSTISEQPSQAHHRRFITRSERNALPGKKSLPNGIDFHYVADATPRSRKPIHMLDTSGGPQSGLPASSGVLRTTKSGLPTSNESWQPQRSQKQPLAKPRSISSSRISELHSYPMPTYSEVQKPKRLASAPVSAPAPTSAATTELDNVICGSLHIKPGEHGCQDYVEIRHRDLHKTNSMPHHYQRCSGEDLPNKYEEYVAEKREQHQQAPAQIFIERKNSLPATTAPIYFPRKKPANLEEAINELEAIYKSLGLTEPAEPEQEPKPLVKPEPKKEPKPRMPTPSEFEKFALAHADDYEDEDSPTGEPDPVRDDVAYRNLQLGHMQYRAAERQPPFGIPVGPIVPAPQSDYLHVEPVRVTSKDKKPGSPDIVKDDLAVRALRKDPPGPKTSFVYPMPKKQRATRTQSANIYSLIQRDAAKPSGGDLGSYMELTRSIERAGSMSNLGGDETKDTSDIPGTLDLLRKLKAQDEELAKKSHIPFRHPSQGGAISQLPERLRHVEAERMAPVPAPRKSLTPEPLLEDALNKIAQDAQASSIKLTQELDELRKEALITAARPKLNAEQQKLEQELQQIEAVSEAAKRCGQLLLDTLPDNDEPNSQQQQQQKIQPNARKLHKEGKLIRAIDEVSEAANAVCEKILKDIVTTEPPVVVHEALQVKQHPTEPQLVTPHLIKKLDPIQSDKIEAIAKRCMRQLSELADPNPPDYDNLSACNTLSTAGATEGSQQVHADATLICPIAGVKTGHRSTLNDDIDRIMQECERQARQTGVNKNSSSMTTVTTSSTDDQHTTAPSMSSRSVSGNATTVSTTASSFSSSSDCLAKSSSPSNASRALSSSITSFNPYSSSDYVKSQSSDYHAPSTDPIRTFSTTSYDVQSTPNSTNTLSTNNTQSTTNNSNTGEKQTASTASPSPSPPLQLTPVGERRARSSSPSQYNSSEELAAIFGIEEKPKSKRLQRKQLAVNLTGNGVAPAQVRQTRQAQAQCNETSFSDAATNPRCALATLVQATATNPVLNVECNLDPELDVATTTTTSSSSSRSYSQVNPSTSTNEGTSNCSSLSCKLATIPELELEVGKETELETEIKLSPNFNRIYASKINIVMDRPEVDSDEINEAPAPAIKTQFDSLSSLEETSSNPDSGNASLADFPLASHVNAFIELQTTHNSRYEIKENYVSEISINALESSDNDEADTGTATKSSIESKKPLVYAREEDFPRLPTEEELLESLREEAKFNKDEHTSDEVLKIDETFTLSEALFALNSDASLNEVDESELDDSDLVAIALDEALLDELDECVPNDEFAECDPVELNMRKKSIVYETPQINLSISEVKLNYETQAALGQEALCEAIKLKIDDKKSGKNDMPIKDTSPRNEQQQHSSDETETARRRRTGLPALTDEQPTTSSKALSVFGEVRTLQAPAGAEMVVGGVTPRGGLTTLEHVLVACTVGLISPNDLLTLCLIVIGVIIIVAIALS